MTKNYSKETSIPSKLKGSKDHNDFLNRITKSLYYIEFPVTDCLSLPVTEMAAELFNGVNHTLDRLDVEKASKISRNACVSPCSLILALLYIEKLKDCNPEYLHQVAPSKLFLVSLMVATKFLNDDGEEDQVFNQEWALSSNLSISQMNQLEKEFLNAIDWCVYVQNQDFWKKLQELEKTIAYKEAQKRGWFSYTELSCLMDSIKLLSLVHEFINISSVCLVAYAIGVVTILGSAIVTSHLPGTQLGSTISKNTENITNVSVNTVEEKERLNQDIEISDVFTTMDFIHATKSDKSCKSNAGVNTSWKWLRSIVNWFQEDTHLNSQALVPMNNVHFNDDISFSIISKFIINSNSSTILIVQ
ncbi:PREDICTED: protein CNPPD1 [Polistes canadensis]|uniref:protein CNPPD1 n=1 Tax=Polistes canadensis TaxID=91411 RepID=UPI000718EAB9|nr:PREDICTED: protein CNPPD1 [Polistes canadensis]